MPADIDPNLVIETSGLTAAVATDTVVFSGTTAHFQLIKLAYGLTGAATIVSPTNPLPVSVSSGMTATISGFTGTLAVEGVVGGEPLTITGTVIVTGNTSAPVYISHISGSPVEVTGGRILTKNTDAISVFGPAGNTWIYTNLVNSSGNAIGNTSNPLIVQLSGVTVSATLSSTVGVTNDSATSGLRVQGLSGGTSLAVTVGNTVGINDTQILNSLSGISSQLGTLNTNLSTLGISVPSSFKTGRVSVTSSSVVQMDSSGYTCENGITVKAINANTNVVYMGNTSGLVGTSFGHALYEGDEIFLKLNNTNKIYLIASSGTQIVTYVAS
jgi:hypothetical protein